MREVQCQRRFEIIPLFREGIRQSREPLAPLTSRSVFALDVGCAGAAQVRRSENFLLLNRNKSAGTIALAALFLFRVDLHDLTVVSAVMQSGVDSVDVGTKAVGAHVEALICGGPSNLRDKIVRARLVAFSEMP